MKSKIIFFIFLWICINPLHASIDTLSVPVSLREIIGPSRQSSMNAEELSSNKIVNALSFNIKDRQAMLKPFVGDEAIMGVTVSGFIVKESPDYMVRVILRDKSGEEYLVLESYAEISNSDTIFFNDYCDETFLMRKIVPDSLKVIANEAQIQLNRVTCLKSGALMTASNSLMDTTQLKDSIRKQQVKNIVDRINAYNKANHRLWFASITSVSLRSYAEKKRIVGYKDDINFGGFEYYGGGIFEVGSHKRKSTVAKQSAQLKNTPMGASAVANTNYAESFDWRTHHGKKWMTNFRDQKLSGYCTGFATVGCIEGLENLYYNQKIDMDLSEEQVSVCCEWPKDPQTHQPLNPYHFGNEIENPLNYVMNHGVCDEQAYPFVDSTVSGCNTSVVPNELVKISGYETMENSENQKSWNSVKEALIKYGPLISGFRVAGSSGSSGHAMALFGYRTIHAGDTINEINVHAYGCIGTIVAGPDKEGEPCWIFKNSWGTSLQNVYMYLPSDGGDTGSMYGPYLPYFPISSLHYDESNVICEDKDGDGFYNWGIGPKPADCPDWIPDLPDGDDSDPSIGPLDEHGMPDSSDNRDTLYITSDTTTTLYTQVYNHIVVKNNATWTVKDNVSFYSGAKLYIRDGSCVRVQSGFLRKVQPIVQHGGRLIINGNVEMPDNTEFAIPIGNRLELNNGKIERQ